MDSLEVVSNRNVIARIVHLPLVVSTFDKVSNVYCNTKNNHPYLKSLCALAENGVKSISIAAFHSALPIFGKLEPQISRLNVLACHGLDKVEKTFPALHKPSEQIMTSAIEAMTGAAEVVSASMSGAKDSVSIAVNEVIDRTRWGMEKTKTVVGDGVETVMDSRMVRLMDMALNSSKTALKNYMTESEETTEHKGVEMNSLRSYQRVVEKVQHVTQSEQQSVLHLKHVDFLKGIDKTLQEKTKSLMVWMTKKEDDTESEVKLEWYTLSVALSLGRQLQSRCVLMVSSFRTIPQQFQLRVLQIYCIFTKTSILVHPSSSNSQLSSVRDSMDNFLDYLINNTPLNWLVGPFYPCLEDINVHQSRWILRVTD